MKTNKQDTSHNLIDNNIMLYIPGNT